MLGCSARKNAPANAPAEVPTTRSNAVVRPSCPNAVTMPADTTPRTPPPSTPRASVAPSERARGLEPSFLRCLSSADTDRVLAAAGVGSSSLAIGRHPMQNWSWSFSQALRGVDEGAPGALPGPSQTRLDGREPMTMRAARSIWTILRHVTNDGTVGARYAFYM